MAEDRFVWVKEYPSDELREIATFSLTERGAYQSLKLIYFSHIEAFQNERTLFAMCLAFSDEEQTAVRTVVERLFKQEGKYPFNTRFEILIEQALKGRTQKSEAGKKSGEELPLPKKEKERIPPSPPEIPSAHEGGGKKNLEVEEKWEGIEKYLKGGDTILLAGNHPGYDPMFLIQTYDNNIWLKGKNPPTENPRAAFFKVCETIVRENPLPKKPLAPGIERLQRVRVASWKRAKGLQVIGLVELIQWEKVNGPMPAKTSEEWALEDQQKQVG